MAATEWGDSESGEFETETGEAGRRNRQLGAAVVAVAALGGTENGAENYNMLAQLWTQTKGSIFTILFTVIVTTIILVIIKNTVGLRVDEAEESVGLDQSAHGETAYND